MKITYSDGVGPLLVRELRGQEDLRAFRTLWDELCDSIPKALGAFLEYECDTILLCGRYIAGYSADGALEWQLDLRHRDELRAKEDTARAARAAEDAKRKSKRQILLEAYGATPEELQAAMQEERAMRRGRGWFAKPKAPTVDYSERPLSNVLVEAEAEAEKQKRPKLYWKMTPYIPEAGAASLPPYTPQGIAASMGASAPKGRWAHCVCPKCALVDVSQSPKDPTQLEFRITPGAVDHLESRIDELIKRTEGDDWDEFFQKQVDALIARLNETKEGTNDDVAE